MTKSKKIKEIVVPILNDEYKVIICFGNPKEVKKVLHDWNYKDPSDITSQINGGRGICFHEQDCHPVIAMPKIPKTPEQIGTLAHEAVHAVGYIFSVIQQESAEEVFAHSVGAIVRNVLNKV